jgi:hypothetical protein
VDTGQRQCIAQEEEAGAIAPLLPGSSTACRRRRGRVAEAGPVRLRVLDRWVNAENPITGFIVVAVVD